MVSNYKQATYCYPPRGGTTQLRFTLRGAWQPQPDRLGTAAAIPSTMLTEADILTALRDCYDPEIPLNIVDLGLVHSIAIAPDPDAPGAGIPGVPPRHRVHIELTLAQIAALEDSPLPAQILNRLAAFETISRTKVTLLREPAWNPGRISTEGRARLANPLSSKKPADALIQIQTNSGKTSA